MEKNIICSGALFYATSTKRFLLLQRTDFKTRGMWGLVGGQARYTESAFDGLKREIEEEVGTTPVFKKYSCWFNDTFYNCYNCFIFLRKCCLLDLFFFEIPTV